MRPVRLAVMEAEEVLQLLAHTLLHLAVAVVAEELYQPLLQVAEVEAELAEPEPLEQHQAEPVVYQQQPQTEPEVKV